MPSRASSITRALPQWTKHVVTDAGGRDPLGLSRVSFAVTDHLLPCIVVNTDRARYYSLYLWALWHIAENEGSKPGCQFANEFQRREAAIAYATRLAKRDASVVGLRTISKKLASAGEDVPTAIRVLPSNPLGGYGQYYGGSLYNLGLTWRPEGGHDMVEDGFGTELAKAVDRTASQAAYLKGGWYKYNRVPVEVLTKSRRLSLDTIRDPVARQERDLLIKLFFSWRNNDEALSPSCRRLTLLRLLNLLRTYEKRRIAVEASAIDFQLVYAPAYYGCLAKSDRTRSVPYQTPPSLLACDQLWRQFCAHEYLTWAVESSFAALLDVAGEAGLAGMTRVDAFAQLLGPQFRKSLENVARGASARPAALMRSIGCRAPDPATGSMPTPARFGLHNELNEVQLVDAERESPPESAALAFVLLAVLYAKWRSATDDLAWVEVRGIAGHEVSIWSVLPRLDAWFDSRLEWADAVADLTGFLIQQHDRVMYEKGRLESCWIETQQERLIRVQDCAPGLRPSRHRQAVSILEDLLLISRDEDANLTLTDRGREVLDHGLECLP